MTELADLDLCWRLSQDPFPRTLAFFLTPSLCLQRAGGAHVPLHSPCVTRSNSSKLAAPGKKRVRGGPDFWRSRTRDGHKALRIIANPTEEKSRRLPSKPMSGKTLPVFGNSAGVAGAAGAAETGWGAASAIRIGASAGGEGGGGGIVPEIFWSRCT